MSFLTRLGTLVPLGGGGGTIYIHEHDKSEQLVLISNIRLLCHILSALNTYLSYFRDARSLNRSPNLIRCTKKDCMLSGMNKLVKKKMF